MINKKDFKLKSDIEIVEGNSCKECEFRDKHYSCREMVVALTGFDCKINRSHFVKKRPEKWVACNSNNTKVGDTVRYAGYPAPNSLCTLHTINYINISGRLVMAQQVGRDSEGSYRICDFEIDLNREK